MTKHDLAVKAAAKASEKAETERVAAEKVNTEKPVADNPINNP